MIRDLRLQMEFINFTKLMKCSVCFQHPVDADHLIAVGSGRNPKKPNTRHWSVVPLCRGHHTERHTMTMSDFNEKHNVDLFKDNHRNLIRFWESREF